MRASPPSRRRALPAFLPLALAFACAIDGLAAATLVSRWRLDEAQAPYADSGAAGIAMNHDTATSEPVPVVGADGGAVYLNFNPNPGVSTRLQASGPAVLTDRFGFSFWISPVEMHPGDNLLAMEMPATTGPAFTRMAWQVQVGADNGSGTALLELVVRGGDRVQGDFFGSVFSAVAVPLRTSRDRWFHVAGGYDSTSGRLSLFVNGVEASALGLPGAPNSRGVGLGVGTVRNGPDTVAYAALTCLDDLRIYDAPLADWEVDALLRVSGRQARLLGHWRLDEASPPFAEAGGRAAAFWHDIASTAPEPAQGVRGAATRLKWDNAPGVSTRLAVYGNEVQSDSFGFSFWVRPAYLASWESLIGKEMLPSSSGAGFTRLAWQVQSGADDGTGLAPLVLVVRGTDRAATDFHGQVASSVKLPLHADPGTWYHVAGGYDSPTGRLLLHVNGVESSSQGVAGATCSDGGAFVIGSMVNDADFIVFAGMAAIDEVQLYDGPLWASDAVHLMENPGGLLSDPLPRHFPGALVAHWRLDGPGPVYADSSGHGNPLETDQVTSPPARPAGVDGDGVQLSWREAEGVTTRLFASGDSFQTHSFGFSFWLKPERLAPGENVIAKEMPPADGPDFTRLGWQVQVGQDNGAGEAPLELVVRGGDRADGNYFGSVTTSASVPLWQAMDEWIHVAGGYDAATGAVSLFLDGRDASARGRPGAKLADGSWFNVGSVRNGVDFVRFGGIAAIDDIQLYDAPLSAYEVAWLRKNPGSVITPSMHFATTGFQGGPADNLWLTFNSHNGWFYGVEASTTMESFVPVTIVRASAESTSVGISQSQLDAVLGAAPRERLFLRAQALLEDPVDGSVPLPPAEILPFSNPAAYVPQFHFSWPTASVGDPAGALRYGGAYHLFTWDHAASTDLLHWQGLGWPLGDTPPDSGYWTGSVVVDANNTSGFGTLGNPPMVAVYTIHNNTTAKETIGISYSTNHRDFTQYAGNPVIATGDQVFRDPDVFWHEPTRRWILLVARSVARQIQFYASQDLKTWTHLSDFAAAGARNEIWEVPGLAELPIRGMGNQRRWLLHVGAGTDKVQYWVGGFDGVTFTVDESTRAYLEDGAGIDGEVFADFESVSFQSAGWTASGSAFGNEPAPRWWGQPAQSHLGQRLASSYVDGDWHVGSALTSPEFTITRNGINFLVGGGNHPGETCVNLVVGGNVVRTATGDDSDVMRWAGWNVAEFKGQQARIQIVDNFGGFWGRIYVDHIHFSDVLVDHRREHAKWVELSPDFFAPKFVRDYDGTETDVKWLGWIGSWRYEANRPVPANWGKGAESIFRKLQLVPSARGYELVQEPVVEMQSLRGPAVTALPRRLTGTAPFAEFQPATNTYEIEAVFALAESAAIFGLNLCVGGSQRVVVGFDAATSNLYLDRRSSGYVSLDPAFPRIVNVPYRPPGDKLKLRIFVDQCSIEVFADDGRQVLTSQIYPDPSGTGIELFSFGAPTTLTSLRAWPLASIWPP